MVATRQIVLVAALLLWPMTATQTADAAGCTGAAPTDVVYLPNVTKDLGGPAGWDTPFIVQNIGATPADLEVSFFLFEDGSLVTCRRIAALPPHASWADDPRGDDDLPFDTQFAVLVRAYGSSISGVVNQTWGTAEVPVAMSYLGVSTGATTIYLPNVTRRFYGYDTPFIVQNLGNATAHVTAKFVSFDGSQRLDVPLEILPARARPVDPDYTAGLVDGSQYAVTLVSDQPITAIVNEFNPFHPFGQPLGDAYNGFTAGDGAPDLYVARFLKTFYAQNGCCQASSIFADSPLVIQNMDTHPVTPSISFYGTGNSIANGGQPFLVTDLTFVGPTLGPGASWSFDPLYRVGTTTPCNATPPFPNPPTCLPSGTYSAHIHADGSIAARATVMTCCVQQAPGVATSSFRAQPLAPVVFLPNVVKTFDWQGGWNSFIYLRAADPSVTMRFTAYWYRFSDGRLVKTQDSGCVQQAPQGCAVFGFTGDPRDDPDLPDATQYSVVIDASGGTPLEAVVITYRLCANCGDAMAYEGIPGG